MKQTSKNYSINEAMLLAVQIAKAGQTVFAAVILDESNQLIAWIIAQRIRIGFGRRNVRLVDNSAGAPRA